MSRLVWAFLGFVGGIAWVRNLQPFGSPVLAAVGLVTVAACGVVWTAAYRGKSTAVATAVAVATVEFEAQLEAKANAIASSAVQVILQQSDARPVAVAGIRAVTSVHDSSSLGSAEVGDEVAPQAVQPFEISALRSWAPPL